VASNSEVELVATEKNYSKEKITKKFRVG